MGRTTGPRCGARQSAGGGSPRPLKLVLGHLRGSLKPAADRGQFLNTFSTYKKVSTAPRYSDADRRLSATQTGNRRPATYILTTASGFLLSETARIRRPTNRLLALFGPVQDQLEANRFTEGKTAAFDRFPCQIRSTPRNEPQRSSRTVNGDGLPGHRFPAVASPSWTIAGRIISRPIGGDTSGVAGPNAPLGANTLFRRGLGTRADHRTG